ncbi:hypothetical protein GW17_00015391 [Ensete ventricosum]|nr:hypothetical protein GW17_00015391 [Ensete ventricosum]
MSTWLWGWRGFVSSSDADVAAELARALMDWVGPLSAILFWLTKISLIILALKGEPRALFNICEKRAEKFPGSGKKRPKKKKRKRISFDIHKFYRD